jgi:hypothetical protein
MSQKSLDLGADKKRGAREKKKKKMETQCMISR